MNPGTIRNLYYPHETYPGNIPNKEDRPYEKGIYGSIELRSGIKFENEFCSE